MLLSWLNANEANELGRSLADHFVPRAGSDSAVRDKKTPLSDQKATEAFLQRVDREARPALTGRPRGLTKQRLTRSVIN